MKIIEEHTDNEGRYHRLDGPAIVYEDGTQEFYYLDLLHNRNGAAVVYPDGRREYWLDGTRYDYVDWLIRKTKRLKVEGVLFDFFKLIDRIEEYSPDGLSGFVDDSFYKKFLKYYDVNNFKESLEKLRNDCKF